MLKLNKFPDQGFGFAQALTGLAVTSVLAVGAYKMLGTVSSVTSTTVARSRATNSSQKVIDQISIDLSNVVGLEDVAQSVLGNVEPDACKPVSGTAKFMSSGIVPLPGRSKSDLSAYSTPTQIDPSDATMVNEATGHTYDAIRYVYRSSETVSCDITKNPSDSNKPYETGAANSLVVSSSCKLKVGDYFVISDVDGMGFGRLTGLGSSCPSGNKCFTKVAGSGGSIWNTSLGNYGRTSSGDALPNGATVERVFLATIAYEPSSKTLYKDYHIKDDGFDPLSATPTVTGNSLAKDWKLLATDVDKFQVNYIVSLDADGTQSTSLRNPRQGEWGEENAATGAVCGNQVGFPNLHQVSIAFETSLYSSSKVVAVSALDTNTYTGTGGGAGAFEEDAIDLEATSSITSASGSGGWQCPCSEGGGY